jgi:DNA-binding NarL/FixJ family response regulator
MILRSAPIMVFFKESSAMGSLSDSAYRDRTLTRTERYVLLLLADGMAAQDVARQLALLVSTIRTHIRNLLGKTRSPSLMQLVRQLGSTTPPAACM